MMWRIMSTENNFWKVIQPEEKGFYFIQLTKKQRPVLVHVYHSCSDIYCCEIESGRDIDKRTYKHYQWWGPINERCLTIPINIFVQE